MTDFIKRATAVFVLILLMGMANTWAQGSARKDMCLWQISGNGLQQSSYILGTYSSQDNRAFTFNDSVYNKMKECNQVAQYLQPDSARKYYLSTDYSVNNLSCKDLLSAKEYRQLEDRYKQYNTKLLHDNAFEVYNNLVDFAYRERHDRENTVDVYLNGLAKLLNKKLVGVSTLRDEVHRFYGGGNNRVKQYILSILQSDREFQPCGNKMLDAYANGDLDEMMSIYKSCGTADYLLFKDQVAGLADIADNIQRLINADATFVILPAAYIPTDVGIIARLRDMGYTVTPVHAPYTGLIDTLAAKPHLNKWITFGGAEIGYTVQMPDTPKLNDAQNVYTYYDPVKGTVFVTIAKHIASERMALGADVLFDSLQSSMGLDKGWHLKQTDIVKKGDIPGRQYDVVEKVMPDAKLTAQVYLLDSTFYMFLVGAEKGTSDSLAEITKYFFQSIKLIDPHLVQLDTISSTAAGISFSMPQGAKFFSQNIPASGNDDDQQPVKVSYWSYDNNVRDMAVVVRYNDLKRGYVIWNYQDHIKSLMGDLKQQFGKMPLYHFMIYKGLPGARFEADTKTSRVKGMFLVRNARTYLFLYAENIKSFDNELADSILNSVEILPLQGEPLKDNSLYSVDLKVKLPEPPFIKLDTTYYIVDDLPSDSNYIVYSRDTLNGQNYTIQLYHLSDYASIENYDSLLANFDRDILVASRKDTLLSTKEVEVNGMKWHEMLVGRILPYHCERIRVAIAGRYLIKVLMLNDRDSLYTANADSFFNSVDFIFKPAPFDLYKDRAGEVLKNIGSANDTIRAQAFSALKAFHFSKKNKEQIHKALLVPSYPDDSLGFNGSRAELITRLYDTDDDKGLAFIEQHYAQIALNTEQRLQVMSYLSRLSNSSAYDMLFDIWKDSLPGARQEPLVYVGIISNLMDSMTLGLPYLQQLPGIAQKHPEITYSVYHAFAKAVSDSVLDYYDIIKSQDIYFSVLSKMLDLRKQQIKDHVDTLSSEEFYIIKDVLTLLRNGRPNKQLQQLLDGFDKIETDKFLNYYVLSAKLKLHYAPNKKHVKELAGDRLFRVAVYNLMVGAGLGKKYPKKYTEPQYWGETDLYNTITDDPEYSNTQPEIVFVESRYIRYNGYEGQVCIYKFRTDKNSPWLFGASGLYVKGRLDPLADAHIVGSNYKAFDKIRITQYLNELVQGSDGSSE